MVKSKPRDPSDDDPVNPPQDRRLAAVLKPASARQQALEQEKRYKDRQKAWNRTVADKEARAEPRPPEENP